jgi:hypothetical protein
LGPLAVVDFPAGKSRAGGLEGLRAHVAAEELALISTGAKDCLGSNGWVEKVDGGYRVSGAQVRRVTVDLLESRLPGALLSRCGRAAACAKRVSARSGLQIVDEESQQLSRFQAFVLA